MTSPRVLFVPVSGPSGMGEFARARSLADAMQARWPNIETHFLLHRDAPYAKEFHHPVTMIPASPTLCTDEVVRTIEQFRPDVVVFDNAGRTGALRAAVRVGARVVYVSSRGRQRFKAFRLRWMGLLDDHWISYPAPIAGGLGFFERLKLRLLGRPQVRFLDAVLAPADERAADELLAQFGSPDLLVVPGGGSQFHDASITPNDFARWSKVVAAQGFRVVFIAGPAFSGGAEDMPGVRLIRGVSGGALHAFLTRTKVVFVNGGDTLLQALALGKACVAVPIAGDQAARIARCAALGAVTAPRAVASTGIEPAEACLELLRDEVLRRALETRVREAGFEDALPALVERLGVHLGLASISSR
ncbi:MAG: glycosyltransferase [Gammaproteobacteria bacterium]